MTRPTQTYDDNPHTAYNSAQKNEQDLQMLWLSRRYSKLYTANIFKLNKVSKT